MKVLLAHSFHYERGGDSTYARALARALEGAGHSVIPLAMRHPLNDPSPWEQHFVSWVDPRSQETHDRLRAGLRMIWSWEGRRAARRLIEQGRPDVAHLQHVHRHLTPSILGPLRRAGVPVVWTLHDYELVCANGLTYRGGAPCERCGGQRFHQAFIHRCKQGALVPSAAAAVEKYAHALLRVTSRVDRFLCPSRWLAQTVVRMGLPADRVFHLPNLVPSTPMAAAPATTGDWLVAGRLSPEKGFNIAIEAARRLPATSTLHICGAGPAESELRSAAAGVAQVRFHGHLSRSALAALIARCAVVAVPSVWPENLPYAVFEAQAVGRTVVASAIGGIPEQVADGRDGLLVPPGDAGALAQAVGSLLADPGRCQLYGRAARARIEAMPGPGAHVRLLESHYEAAARHAGPGSIRL